MVLDSWLQSLVYYNGFNTSHQVATCAMLVHFLVTVYVEMHQCHALLSLQQALYCSMTLSF